MRTKSTLHLLFTAATVAALSSGCATVQTWQVTKGEASCYDLCGTTPFAFGGTVNAFRRATLTCAYSGERGLGYLVTYPLLFPVYFVDIPLSVAADTVSLPYTAYQQAKVGNICSGE